MRTWCSHEQGVQASNLGLRLARRRSLAASQRHPKVGPIAFDARSLAILDELGDDSLEMLEKVCNGLET